ncbi:hypothetical protein [Nocardioides sp. Root190]|nr:hypothetical protein [Nocardioides sp. Root190]
MNIIIATIVGALASTTVLIAGVNAVQNGDSQQSVSSEQLSSYSDQ